MVYLVCGDDEPKLDAWRLRLRRRAEESGGPGALESYDAASASPAQVAAALAAMTLGAEDRYIAVDGVETWKAGDLEPLERALAAPPEGTILLLVARGKPPARLAKAVAAAGGEQRELSAPKPWELPRWVEERARECELTLDRDAARTLVAIVGPRQRRLATEIERLAIAVHPRRTLTAAEVEEHCADGRSEQAYELADALAGGDPRQALARAERLTGAGERPSKLVFPIVRRLREVQRAAELLDAGVPEREAQAALRQPPWLWKRTAAQAKRADREALTRALCAFADLEIEARGGGSGLDEDTAFSLALAQPLRAARG